MQRVKIWNYLSSKLSNEISYGMCYVEDLSEISAAYCEVQILALCLFKNIFKLKHIKFRPIL